MKQFKRIISLLLCTCLVLSGAVFGTERQTDVVYNAASTMSHGHYKAQTIASSTSAVTDTYFDKQWALYNDGTFTYEDYNKSPNVPKEDYSFPDINNFFNGGEFEIQMPDHHRGFYKRNSIYTTNNYGSTPLFENTSAVKGIDIDATKAWNAVSTSGKQVIIAIIDTGVDYTHEDLQNSTWTNLGEKAGDGVDNDNNGYIDDVYGWDFCNNQPYQRTSTTSEYEHGTHIAGIIAASVNNDKGIAGIAGSSNVKLMSIKALSGSEGSGSVDSVVNAIKYAQKMGASICNLSFGTESYDKELKQVMKESDMLFICAAGNADRSYQGSNTDQLPVYPASYDLDNIISVANLTYDGTLDTTSNYGKTSVDIAAPGSYIISSLPDNTYGYMSGTSMAAPMVTAVAAMVYSQREVALTQVKDILLNSSVQLSSLQNKVACGGMLNAYNALTANISGSK